LVTIFIMTAARAAAARMTVPRDFFTRSYPEAIFLAFSTASSMPPTM
jgi:hypothetical protein